VEIKDIKYYLKHFTKLRRDNKYGGAPHKPILLLSIINNIEEGLIASNKILITPELVGTFKSLWADLVISERHHCYFSLPYFHMSSEPFWLLIPNFGYENIIKSNIKIRGLSNLKDAIRFAEIDLELFLLLLNQEQREILKLSILTKYFPNFIPSSSSNNGYVNSIKSEIVNEPSEIYRKKLLALEKELDKEEFEEEKFLRSHLFKQQVSLSYNNTCAISRLKIDVTSNASLIDGCHIIPFSQSYDDTILNGVSLSPTLHRAFDRGLISIDDSYRIQVSNSFSESGESCYSIKQFQGEKILLPNNITHHPKVENFNWHHKNIFVR
jgi:putative restriction endonuclease